MLTPLELAVTTVLPAVLVHSLRAMAHGAPRDPARYFDVVTTATVLANAGWRCEEHGPLGRCIADAGLRAVHVHPWARGGQTAAANARAACPEHARTHRHGVPSQRRLRRLAERRAAYFPLGADPVVRRHATPRCAPQVVRVTVNG